MTGDELKALRESTGLTQEIFGVTVLGVTGATVCRWESEDRPIPDLKADGIRWRVEKHLAEKKKT